MAPTTAQIERQTSEIIKYLFDDEDDNLRSGELDAGLETDGPTDESFDPVVIADKLRSVADALNDDIKFKAVLTDMKQAAAQQAVEEAFSHGVEVLCQAQVSQRAEVAPEMQLIKAAVTFGLFVKKSFPELKTKVQSAMTVFLNRRVGPWVAQQGGWDKVTNI